MAQPIPSPPPPLRVERIYVGTKHPEGFRLHVEATDGTTVHLQMDLRSAAGLSVAITEALLARGRLAHRRTTQPRSQSATWRSLSRDRDDGLRFSLETPAGRVLRVHLAPDDAREFLDVLGNYPDLGAACTQSETSSGAAA